MLFAPIRVFPIVGIDIYFPVEIETAHIAPFGAEAVQQIGRGQAIVENHLAAVGFILDVAFGSGDRQELGHAKAVGLPIRAHFHAVVVGQY